MEALRGERTSWLAGFTLVVLFGALAVLSSGFAYGRSALDKPVFTFVMLLMVAGAVYLAALRRMRPWSGDVQRPRWSLWMLGVGLVMRAVMFGATPILEDDYYRYLWDGAVVVQGHNPYRHSPEEVVNGVAPLTLQRLANSSQPIVERINYPSLRTIYPPMAQAAFAAAHGILPWRVDGLRLVWLAFDMGTLGLLVLLLRQLALPAAVVMVYWWNPLLVQQVYGSLHMDVLVLPLVVGALSLLVRQRARMSGLALALAAGAKLWPALLIALPLRQSWPRWHKMMGVGLALAVPAVLLMMPVWWVGLGEDAGFTAYGERWQMNDSIFMGVYWAARLLSETHAQMIARGLIVALLLGWMAWLCRRPAPNGRVVCERALWIVAALFLLSPTQFPWYWLWLLPLLAIRPSPGLLVLTATLPLYYLRFRFAALGHAAWFDYGIVWLEYLPAWTLLAWEARRTSGVKLSRVTNEFAAYES